MIDGDNDDDDDKLELGLIEAHDKLLNDYLTYNKVDDAVFKQESFQESIKNNETSPNNLTSNKEELNKTEKIVDFVYKEGGWGWIVVIATSYCFAILIGMINNYALIYNKFDIVYNQTSNHVVYAAWIGSISTGLQFFLCMLGSVLTDFFNPRKIGVLGGLISALSLIACAFVTNIKLYILTYGIMYGIGQSLLLASTLAILPHYFNKRLALANGLMSFLASIIIVLLPIFTSYILNKYGLSETFYFLAAINLLTAIMALTYIPLLPLNSNESRLIHKIKQSFGLKVFRRKKYVIWCCASFIGMFGYLIPIVNIDHHSIKTFPNSHPVIINVVFGCTSGLSSIVFGKIGDITKFNRVYYHMIVYLIYGIVQISIPFAHNFVVFVIQLGILGILDGIWLGFIVPISFDLAKSSKLANQASGYYHTIMAPTAVAGPVVAGLIYEKYHSYDNAFYIGGSACLLSAFIIIICLMVLDRAKKSERVAKS